MNLTRPPEDTFLGGTDPRSGPTQENGRASAMLGQERVHDGAHFHQLHTTIGGRPGSLETRLGVAIAAGVTNRLWSLEELVERTSQ
jgi:hypothetical protein